MVEEFINKRTLRVKLADHHSSDGTVKSGVPPGHLIFLIFINDLADELTCNHLVFADDFKLIAPSITLHDITYA